MTTAPPPAFVTWTTADGRSECARWRSAAGRPAPARVREVDDRLSVAEALRALRAGEALLWRGDYPNARHFLQALARRVDRHFAGNPEKTPASAAEAFRAHRRRQGERATLLAGLLVPLEAGYRVPLPRAQDVSAPCQAVFGPPDGEASVLALRELLALISAHEWYKRGVPVPAAGGHIHPQYGVFSPVRGEYVELVAQAPLPAGAERAFDIGTGSGVLAAVLARRGLSVVATDVSSRALACATENARRLGLTARIEVIEADLFPPGQAPLVVCNPPWLPAEPSAPVEAAVYDPDSQMLRGFLGGLAAHLTPGGEGWLILSDLAEHLGLRTRAALLDWIAAGGLRVIDRLDVRPQHPKSRDARDPLHAARAAEVTSLWRLGHA